MLFRFFIVLIAASSYLHVSAQDNELTLFRPTRPVKVDTLYYPFYNNVQMIEIDNVGYWEANVNFHEMSQPRALSWSMLIPGPFPNVYLFRDTSGEIVKAFNSSTPLWQLTMDFRKVPLNKKSSDIAHVLTGGKHTGKYHSGWADYHSRMIDFDGFYLVYDTVATGMNYLTRAGTVGRSGKVGLIDSFGNYFLNTEYDNIIPVKNDILIVKDSLCGIIDKQKNAVVPMEYDNYNFAAQDELVFYREVKIYLIYAMYKDSMYKVDGYDHISFDAMHYDRYNPTATYQYVNYPFRKDGKTGLLDNNYEVITPALYDYIGGYVEDRAVCSRDKKFGYLDRSGKEIIPCIYTYVEYFRKGVGVVQHNGEFRNVDKDGKLLDITAVRPEPWRNNRDATFIGELQVVQTGTGYGLIDKASQFVIPPVYAMIRPLITFIPPKIPGHGKTVGPVPDVFLAKQYPNDQWGIVSTSGEVLLPFEYELVADYPTAAGFRVVKKDETHWGVVDRNYKLVVPCIYEGIGTGYDDDYFTFYLDGKVGVMDTTGQIQIPAEYKQIHRFVSGRAMALKDSLYGFIDREGNTVIPFRYEQFQGEFENGLVAFKEKNEWGFLDTNASVIIAPQYEEVRRFESAITGVMLNDKWGFIDRENKLVVKFEYDFVGHEWGHDSLVEVRRNGKIGYVNSEGKEVIPCIYDSSRGYSPEKGHHLEKDGQRVWVKAE